MDTVIVLLIVAVGVIGLLLGAGLSQLSVSSGLRRLRAAVTSITAGDFRARVHPLPGGPAGEAADSFNHMAQTLEGMVAEARQERSRLAAALNSGIDALAAVDGSGNILFANPALETLFTRSQDEIIGRPFAWLLPDDRLVDAIRAARSDGQPQVTLLERPGRRFLQVVTTPITGGGDWAVLVVFHDLTDIHRTEQMRRDFIANVSHELRTPLAGINSVIETLIAGAIDDRPAAEDFLRRADNEVDRLSELVEELLELSRIESGERPLELKPTELGVLVKAAADRLRPQSERKRQVLTVSIANDLGVIELDAARIERALINLIHNAIKFTPDDGSVVVEARREDDSVVLVVRDSGIGISVENLPRVFERFYKVDQSRASGGSGLGLALVKHAVESHGGSVRVESRLGTGSSFIISIPLRPQPAEPSIALP